MAVEGCRMGSAKDSGRSKGKERQWQRQWAGYEKAAAPARYSASQDSPPAVTQLLTTGNGFGDGAPHTPYSCIRDNDGQRRKLRTSATSISGLPHEPLQCAQCHALSFPAVHVRSITKSAAATGPNNPVALSRRT